MPAANAARRLRLRKNRMVVSGRQFGKRSLSREDHREPRGRGLRDDSSESLVSGSQNEDIERFQDPRHVPSGSGPGDRPVQAELGNELVEFGAVLHLFGSFRRADDRAAKPRQVPEMQREGSG